MTAASSCCPDWDYVASETLESVYPDGFPGWEIEHGGVLETSLMLHLQPGLVNLERSVDHPPADLPKFDRLPVVPSRTPATGCLSSPKGSTQTKASSFSSKLWTRSPVTSPANSV